MRLLFFLSELQRFEHVCTSSQHRSHFFLQVNGRWQTTHVFTGRLFGFRTDDEANMLMKAGERERGCRTAARGGTRWRTVVTGGTRVQSSAARASMYGTSPVARARRTVRG